MLRLVYVNEPYGEREVGYGIYEKFYTSALDPTPFPFQFLKLLLQ